MTGSCFLIETKGSKVLVDCGVFQGNRFVCEQNLEEFNFDPKEIDAVLVTHAHYDHVGRIPVLVKQGFKGQVFMTRPTKELASIVLDDAAKVMEENARKHGDAILFTAEDAKKAEKLFVGVNYGMRVGIHHDLHATFGQAGHILGSAFVAVDVEAHALKGRKAKRFVFSGDIGNDAIPILPSVGRIDRADVVVCESTYGDEVHEEPESRRTKLIQAVTRVINRGGTLLIPAFSIERTQELIYELDGLVDDDLIPKVPVYLDSPLAIRATRVYRKYSDYLEFDRDIGASKDGDLLSFDRLKSTLSVDESMRINDDRRPKIIIAGSGMMTGGRILHHLKRYLDDEKSGVLIIGYQAEGTLGRKIQDGAKKVRVHDKELKVKASISTIGAFSAHADQAMLADWLTPEEGDVKEVFLVHGDVETKVKFREYLEGELAGKVRIPGFLENIEY